MANNNENDGRIIAKKRWLKLDERRQSTLQKARECAELTIPSLMPPEGSNQDTPLPTPWQGLGARAVNNLASKLLLTLLPPNSPFFRLTIDDFTLEELTGDESLRAEIEEGLNKIERSVMNEVETNAIGASSFEAIRYLIVTGDACLFLPDEGRMKVYRKDRYVVKRDPLGNVLELITKDSVSLLALPEDIREAVSSMVKEDEKESIDLYTYVRRVGNKWEVFQEVVEEEIPGTRGTYPIDKSPWIPLRWNGLSGEDYGRGLVEEYLGDFRTLESLTKAVSEGAMAAAMTIFLVSPASHTRVTQLQKAKNMSFIQGNRDDVTALQLDKFADFRIAHEEINRISERLARAFLMVESIQRDAERVTATEIRRMAKELEDALGGTYSVLSQEFQLPLVNRLMARMQKAGNLPELPETSVKPAIVTGISALGRGNDFDRLQVFVQTVASTLPPEVVAQYVNVADYLKRTATSLGLDQSGLVRSEEEVQQMQMQQMMAQMAQQAVPGMAQEVTKGVVEGAQQQPEGGA